MAISTNATLTGSTSKLQPYEQIFYTSGTWVKPAGVTEVEVTCVGGGAGGYGFAGGSAGGYIKRLVNVTGISSAAILVGAGSSGTASSSFPGNGGTSSFGNIMYAYGGIGYTSRWTNYSQSIGTLDAGLTEYIQTVGDGVIQLRHQEISYQNIQQSSISLPIGGNLIGPNNKVFYTGSQFVSVYPGTTYVATSPDAITWTNINSTPVNISTVAYNGTYYVSVQSGVISTTALYSSTLANGSWTYTTLPVNQSWTGVVYGNGVFVAWANGSTAGAYSTNGTTWTSLTFPSAQATTMAYLGGYFLGNQVYSATGTSFSSTGMGITPTFFSYGNGIWIASQQILGTGTGTTYYYTSNPASWSAGYTTGSLSNGQGTMSYVGNPVFIYDRFVITGGNANANYSNQTYMWTSTDGYNWTFVRTKQNPYYSNNPGLYYFQDVINMPNNKYYVHVLGHQNEGSTTSYNASMFWAFSPYFGGGFTGMSSNIQGSATNNYTSNAGFAPGSPGAGSSPSNDFASTWNTSYASTVVSGTYALGFAGSGIASDGFAQGAMFDAYYDWYEDSQGTTVKGLPGSGGRGYSSTSLGSGNLPWQPGANGIVILKWWQ